MATKETKLQIVVDAENRTQSTFNTLKGNLDGMRSTLATLGTVGAVSFGALTTALIFSARETMENEAAQNRLSHILKTARKATDEQVRSLFDQAEAMQKVGVVAAENVIQTQAQLATFDLTAESIKRLTPSILDYVIAEKGAAATTEDFKQLTNGLAQALQGNFTSLTKTGFVLDDATRALIANGSEAERTAALVGVLNSTYEGFNVSARETAEGSMIALGNEMRDLSQTIGETFLPIIRDLVQAIRPTVESITAWVKENPELTKTIIIITLAVTGLLAVLLPISLMLPGLIMLFTGLGVAFAALTAISAPMLLVIGAIIAVLGILVSEGYLTKEAWQDVWLGIKLIAAEAANSVIGTVEAMINFIIGGVNKAIQAINKVISLAQKVPGLGKAIPKIQELGGVDLGGFDTDTIVANDLAGRSNPLMTPATSIQMANNIFLDETVAEKIGDMIMSKLKLSNLL